MADIVNGIIIFFFCLWIGVNAVTTWTDKPEPQKRDGDLAACSILVLICLLGALYSLVEALTGFNGHGVVQVLCGVVAAMFWTTAGFETLEMI